MPEPITNCPHCDKHCPLSAPGCGKGERYARQLRGEPVPEGAEHDRHSHGEGHGERHEHHEHEHRGEHHGEHRGGHRHGHGEH